MRSPRQRTVGAAVAVAVIAAGGAFACASWTALFPGDPAIDCETYEFPAQEWRAARRWGPTQDGPRARQIARAVVRCKLVLNRSRRQVRALLGEPEELTSGERRWHYVVGTNGSVVDEDDVSFVVTFTGGRAVSATPP